MVNLIWELLMCGECNIPLGSYFAGKGCKSFPQKAVAFQLRLINLVKFSLVTAYDAAQR